MKILSGHLAALVSVVLGIAHVRAELTLAPLFRDGAVLQRDQPVPVWGTAKPGAKVRVQFGPQAVDTIADARGGWTVHLAPLKASATSAELVVTEAEEKPLRVRDVLVGEVWLCAGQSNMGFRVAGSISAAADIPAANYPLIREYDVPTVTAATPQSISAGSWVATTPENVRLFTAVGYYFALELHRALGVPVGFIRSAPGGTRIEAWMGADALASDPAFAIVGERWQETLTGYNARRAAYEKLLAAWEAEAAAAKAAGRKFEKTKPVEVPALGLGAPSGLYNGMIHPFAPYALRGFVWYQGESNHRRPDEYRALFPAMIRQWRHAFAQENAPFYFVQLANYTEPTDTTGKLWAYLRESQASALALPNTGMAVAVDVGDANNLHPPDKPSVGHRLALVARVKTYGEKIACDSPRAIGFEKTANGMRIRLSEAAGLHLAEGRSGGAEIAGADKVFHPATIRVDGESVLIASPQVATPVAVRYAWANAPETSLYNGAGLPVAPFRSDDW